MGTTDQALWVMERNSAQPLTLNDIAAACGVSRSHLANAFATATGVPVIKYLKARRLSEAAARLAAGAPDILSIALEFGYGSHEAFTRAFRDQFGVTPETVRGRASVDGLAITPPLALGDGRPRPLLPWLEPMGAMKLVGLAAPCTPGETIHIPAQWQRFMSSFYEDIPDKAHEMPIGLCAPPDDEGAFNYVAATRVHDFGDLPPGLTRYECPARTYAVFAHNDHVSTIYDTYRTILNEALPALGRTVANSPVLEFHNAAFDPDTGLGGLRLCIPLEG